MIASFSRLWSNKITETARSKSQTAIELATCTSAGFGDAAPPEFLDRYPWMAILLLVLLPLMVHLPLLVTGRSTDPLWLLSNVTETSSRPPGQPWLDPNVGYTSEALGRVAARDWLHGTVPWWNPFTGIGMPLAGELQPGSFFLPFTFLFLLPDGILWQRICMQIIAAIGTYALLRELGLSRLASLLGGALYGLNGTISWSPGPAAVYCGLAFLPWQILGVEIARKATKGAQSVLVFGLAIGWSILAGFPEPSYISGLLVLAWALYRFFTVAERWRIVKRTSLGFLLGLLVSTPVLISFLDYVRASDSFKVHTLGDQALPWASFSMMLMPYIYGSIGSNYQSEQLTDIWGSVGGYCGVLLVVMAFTGVVAKSRERGLRWLLAGWVVLSLAKTFGLQPAQFLINHLPLLHQAAFYRYAPPSWVFALIVLAAFGLDDFRESAPQRRYAFGLAFGLIGIGIVCAWPTRAYWQRPHSRDSLLFVFLGIAVLWAMAGLLASLGTWTWMRGERRRTVLTALLVVDAAVMFTVPQISSIRPIRMDTPALAFLREHQGLSRTYALDSPLQPNYSAYFGIASINHNVLPVPKLWADYVDQHLEPGSLADGAGVVFSPVNSGQGSGERNLSRDPSGFLDLSVRYVITNPGWTPEGKQFVPMANAKLGQAVSFKVTLLSRLALVRERADSIAGNPGKPAIERSLAQVLVKHLPAQASAAGLDAVDTQHITLAEGQQLQLDLPAPAPVPAGAGITAVAMVVPGMDTASVAGLNVQLCAASDCGRGERLLADLKEGGFLEVPLDRSLHAAQGTLLHLTVTYKDGEKPLKLSAVAPINGQEEHLQGPQGAITDRILDLALNYGDPISGAHKVYADSLMDIWELQNVVPYFEVTRGGPCTLASVEREKVMADCAAPATLRRRELYMPGWDVSLNGGKKVPVGQDGIFESTELAAGHSQARFDFVPPYEGIGWAACFVGFGGLIWQLFLVIGERHTSVVEGN